MALLLALIAPFPTQATGGTGAIAGTVFDSTAAPAADVFVYACSETCTDTTSAPDGTYSISGLAPGTYRVGIQDLSGKLPGGYATLTGLTTSAAQAEPIAVGATPVAFDVHATSGPRIGGMVTASAGGPVGNVLILACIAGSLLPPDVGFEPCGLDRTASDGTYALSVLPGTYEVYALDLAHAHASGYFAPGGYAPGERLASRVAVGVADVGGINLVLPDGHAIAGTVTDAASAPIDGIEVWACLTTAPSDCGVATAGSDGSYTVEGLPTGTYDVLFSDPTATHAMGFYRTTGFTGDSGQATAVVVAASDISGVDIQLPDGHVVSGVVTDASGAGAHVVIADCTSSLCVQATITGADGSYRLNLAPGKHEIHVSDYSGANLSGYYSTAGPANGLHATLLTVASSDLAGISVRLRRIGAGVHAGTLHTGTYARSIVVTKGTYATARFTFGKTYAGTRVSILRAVKSSTGVWSTYRSVGTAVVAADGNAYYSAKISGSLAFRASESDNLVAGVHVLSAPVYARSR